MATEAPETRGGSQIRTFGQAMQVELDANAWKGHWTDQTLHGLCWEAFYHVLKLVVASREENPDPVAVLEFAADTGNEAMFIADKLQVLSSANIEPDASMGALRNSGEALDELKVWYEKHFGPLTDEDRVASG